MQANKNRPIITFRLCLGRSAGGRNVKTVLTCNVPFTSEAARDRGSKEIQEALKTLDKYEIFQQMKYEHATEIIDLEKGVDALTEQAEKVSLSDPIPPTPQPETDSRG